jgi:hypothetical protein
LKDFYENSSKIRKRLMKLLAGFSQNAAMILRRQKPGHLGSGGCKSCVNFSINFIPKLINLFEKIQQFAQKFKHKFQQILPASLSAVLLIELLYHLHLQLACNSFPRSDRMHLYQCHRRTAQKVRSHIHPRIH